MLDGGNIVYHFKRLIKIMMKVESDDINFSVIFVNIRLKYV